MIGYNTTTTVTDHLSPDKRKENMRSIRASHTVPEVAVRSFLHKLGFRFRVAPTELPGKPDIVLPKHRAVIFVDGCFWHRHPGCSRATTPSTNTAYWLRKFDATVARDQRNRELLSGHGWRVFVVWECEVRRDPCGVGRQIAEALCGSAKWTAEAKPAVLLRVAEKRSRYLAAKQR